MKRRRHFFSIISGVVLFLLFSCNDFKDMEIPESISVSTSDKSYSFPLGEGSFLIRDKISASELRDTFNENLDEGAAEIKVYDYAPGGKDNDDQVLQYLIKYPIQEISLSVSTDGSNDMKISSSIAIPNLNSTISDTLSIDKQTYTIIETGTSIAIPDNNGVTFDITSPDFDTMEVYSGYFVIGVEAPSNVSSDFSLFAKVVLTDTEGNEISSSDGQNITGKTSFLLPLAGRTLVPDMRLKFSGSMSGGTAGNILSYEVSMQTSDFRIAKVTGLYMSAEDIGDLDNDESTPDGTVTFSDSFTFSGMSDSLLSASVAKGYLNIYSQIPDGWSGLNTEVTGISVYQSEDFSLGEDDFNDVSSENGNYLFNKTADISGKTITPSSDSNPSTEITLTGKVAVSFENATISFDDGAENPKIKVLGRCVIDEIGDIEVSLSSLSDTATTRGTVETGLSFSDLLEDVLGEADSLIKNVEFSGIEGYVYAIQPGLDILDGLSYSSCNITASYDDDGVSRTTTLLSGDSVSLKKVDIDLDSLAIDDTYTITDGSILEEANFSARTMENSVCTLFNAMPDNLKFSYELNGFSGTEGDTIKLTQEDIDKLKNVKSIQIYILIQVPLRFTLNDKYDYPDGTLHNDGYITVADARKLAKIINGDDDDDKDDLFDRDDADDYEDAKKFLDIIKSVKITYSTANTTNVEIAGKITDAASGLEKELSFENIAGKKDEDGNALVAQVELTTEEIKSVFDNYPFNPVVPVWITADGVEKEVLRNAEFGLKGFVTVTTGGTAEIWSKK